MNRFIQWETRQIKSIVYNDQHKNFDLKARFVFSYYELRSKTQTKQNQVDNPFVAFKEKHQKGLNFSNPLYR